MTAAVRTKGGNHAAETLALDVRQVVSGYETTTVLHHVDVRVRSHSVTALLGPNGAGKTTLLRTIAGLIQPTSGSIHLEGTDVTSLSPVKRARRGLCLIPEGHAVFRRLTVRENLVLQCSKGDAAVALEKATTVFPILGKRMNQNAGTMSGGEQQMLALARAYVTDPTLILVDEASLGLAPLVVELVFEFLQTLAAHGSALLIVDQFMARALAMANYAYVLSHGEVLAEGTPAELGRSEVFETYFGGN